jgi:hypothetical protein
VNKWWAENNFGAQVQAPREPRALWKKRLQKEDCHVLHSVLKHPHFKPESSARTGEHPERASQGGLIRARKERAHFSELERVAVQWNKRRSEPGDTVARTGAAFAEFPLVLLNSFLNHLLAAESWRT